MRRSLVPVLLAAACGGGADMTGFSSSIGGVAATSEGTSTGAPPAGSSSGADSGSGTTTGTTTGTTGDGGADSTPVQDLGMPDFAPPAPAGCQGKIDFMFVIAAVGTMKDQQEQLLASFPGFINAIEQQLPGFDVHILSADPDGGWITPDCSLCTDSCDPEGTPPYCGAELTGCDREIGAGVTYPSGANASNTRCELAGGHRYITAEEPDLLEAFTCIARVGTNGGASAGEAMTAALQPAINDPQQDGCNAGFLRDDALLVVTIIQDVYDEDSAGTVEEWIAALRDAKHGDDDAFAVLVLTTDVDAGPWELCWPGKYDMHKNRLRLLVEGVKHGFIGSICAEAYDPFFADTVAALVELCEGFVAPG